MAETIKTVVSASLSSSARDSQFVVKFLGQTTRVQRIGTDGDVDKLLKVIDGWDGLADVIGLGGMDREIWFGRKQFIIKAADRIAQHVKKSMVVDGTRVKRWVEPLIIEYLHKNRILDFHESKVLVVCGADRSGMARAVTRLGKKVIFGDLMFSFGWPIPIFGYWLLCLIGKIFFGFGADKLPLQVIYPLKGQSKIEPKYGWYYQWADVIIGDFHFIKKHLPLEPGSLKGRTIITNTVTSGDLILLKELGVARLVTPMHAFERRFPATNVIEGILVCLVGKPLEEITEQDFLLVLTEMGWKPTITDLSN